LLAQTAPDLTCCLSIYKQGNMKRMLINATQQEELRMAMVDGQRLYDLNIEGPASERKKANIYKGKITRIEPSLEAAFVDYGAERHGFLPLKEISPEYFVKAHEGGGKPNIRDVLKEGQDIVVQIDKEERGNKGAALTTFVSLAGRFIVLKPNKARSGGVSRRIVGQDRDAARKSLGDIDVPEGMSVILRTAGIDRSPEELQWDLENLMAVWRAFFDARVIDRPSPFLIYRESNAVVRALRDYLTNEIGEILIDDEQTHKEALEFVEQVMPHNARKLKHYSDPVPLFTRYQIESQIESAFAHSVNLPSGGSVVIDHTEALVSIDINSARATKGGDIEATALNTNLEAADEIARQLRIRDLGGLIVIDFIDMGPQKAQREVENRLREAVRQDRARVQIGKISRFGLLEMSRQRLRPSLGESSYQTCPRCSGIGTIRSVESLALAILRLVGEEARKERTAKVIAQLPVEVATYLLNEKRDWVQSLEADNEMQVVLIANPALETPHYEVRRVRDDQTELPENAGASYLLAEAAPEPVIPQALHERAPTETAAVATVQPSTPAPRRPEPAIQEEEEAQAPGGLFAWLTGLFSGETEEKEPAPAARKKTKKKTQRSSKAGADKSRSTRSRGGKRTRSGRRTGEQQDQQKQSRSGDQRGGSKKKTKKKTQKRAADTRQKEQKSATQATAADEKATADGAKAKSSRSRRRGGRRRRRSQDRTDGSTVNQQNATGSDAQGKQDSQAEKPAPKQDAKSSPKPADAKGSGKADADARSDKPKTDTRSNQPKADRQGDKPKSDARSDKPKADSASDKPKADSSSDQRKADTQGGSAKADSRSDKPKTEPRSEKPGADTRPGESAPAQEAAATSKPVDKAAAQGDAKASKKDSQTTHADTGSEGSNRAPAKSSSSTSKSPAPEKQTESQPAASEKSPAPAKSAATGDQGNGQSAGKSTDAAKPKAPTERLLPWEPISPPAETAKPEPAPAESAPPKVDQSTPSPSKDASNSPADQ
jgi:ribonuclease E